MTTSEEAWEQAEKVEISRQIEQGLKDLDDFVWSFEASAEFDKMTPNQRSDHIHLWFAKAYPFLRERGYLPHYESSGVCDQDIGGWVITD